MAAAMAAAGGAVAQDFPSKPVQIIVPFTAGGGADVIVRALAQRLAETWGRNVVIDNRAGASGMIGTELAAKAEPDGHTLLLASPAEVAINQFLYPSMPYDPERDLVPVTTAAIFRSCVVSPTFLALDRKAK